MAILRCKRDERDKRILCSSVAELQNAKSELTWRFESTRGTHMFLWLALETKVQHLPSLKPKSVQVEKTYIVQLRWIGVFTQWIRPIFPQNKPNLLYRFISFSVKVTSQDVWLVLWWDSVFELVVVLLKTECVVTGLSSLRYYFGFLQSNNRHGLSHSRG